MNLLDLRAWIERRRDGVRTTPRRAHAAATPGDTSRRALLADPEAIDELPVPVGVVTLQVVEQSAALADHLEQAAPAVVVLQVGLEMPRELVDPVGEQRHLHVGGAGVGVVGAVVAN